MTEEKKLPERKESIITESIVAAVRKSSAEETGSTEERDISEAVPPEVRAEKSGFASKVKNRPGKLSPVFITVLIVSAFAVLAGYLINNSSTEKIYPDSGFTQEVDLIPDEDSPSESANKGSETGETVAGERFNIHVSAWKTKGYAMSINKKVMSFYPDAIMVFENNYYIIMVPNIASREEALSIAEELADRLNVSPLIYSSRNITEISKTDKVIALTIAEAL